MLLLIYQRSRGFDLGRNDVLVYSPPRLAQHPDKCPGDDAAKGRFQALSLVHSVLSDPERRSLYDETGDIAEEGQDGNAEGEELW